MYFIHRFNKSHRVKFRKPHFADIIKMHVMFLFRMCTTAIVGIVIFCLFDFSVRQQMSSMPVHMAYSGLIVLLLETQCDPTTAISPRFEERKLIITVFSIDIHSIWPNRPKPHGVAIYTRT